MGDRPIYGFVVDLNEKGWRLLGRDNYVRSLSQEHGVVHLEEDAFDQVKLGGLLGVMPVHSCLVVDTLGYVVDLNGTRYDTMRVR
jgi:D-serine deaminase-like pyridoxal phosphate-dependent protein